MTSDQTASHWPGRYSDGKTAGSVPVEVRIGRRGLELGIAGQQQALVWPYGALGVATPIAGGSADVLVTYSYQPGASLFVADPTFVRALAGVAPQLTARAYSWRAARPWMLAAACVLAIGVAVWLSDLSVTRAVAHWMPDNVRKRVGEQVVVSMGGGRKVCDNKAGRAALDALAERLSAASGSPTRFTVVVLDWGLLNAFAAPGEQIVLTRELITRAQSPDEVAGVLAHEMGHGLERHPESSIIRVVGMSAAIELMMGGGGSALANIGLMLTQLGYTRVAEREADGHALRMLEQARISPKGTVDFFKRVEQLEKKAGAPEWDLIRSHPQTAERAKRFEEQKSYAATPALTAEQWQALRSICAVARPAPATKT